jgi:hypothetical protein
MGTDPIEKYSNANPKSSLSLDKARQVCTHPNWVRENLPVQKVAVVVPVLVTPVKVADTTALANLKDVFVWDLDDFRKWSRNAMAVMRQLRKEYPSSGDLAWRAKAAEALGNAAISPAKPQEMLSKRIGAVVLKNS